MNTPFCSLLLLLLFFSACNSSPSGDPAPASAAVLYASGAAEIPEDDQLPIPVEQNNDLSVLTAQSMIRAYLQHENTMKVKLRMGGVDSLVPLHGIKIDIEVLRAIIDRNGKPNPDISAIYLMPAVRACDLENNPAQQYFTMILGGLKEDGSLVQTSLKDYFDPCPVACPAPGILDSIYPVYPEATMDDCR